MITLKKRILAVLAILGIAISATYFLGVDESNSFVIPSTLFLLPPLLAVICGVYAAKTYGISNIHGKAMALMTSGILCLFIGESIFFAYQFIFKIDPFPSVADVFYLAAYPLLFAGLLKEVRLTKTDWGKINRFATVVSVLLFSVLAFSVLYFGVFRAYLASESLTSNIIAMAYGIGDLILIVPALLVLKTAFDYRGGKLFYSWMLILLAILMTMVGDLLFAIFHEQYGELIRPYLMIDFAWIAGYLLFAYSFFYTATTIKELRAKLKAK